MRPPCPTGKLAEETAPAVSSSQVPLTIFFHTNSSPGRRFPSLSRRDCDLHAPQGNSRKKPPQRFLLPRSLSRFSFIRTHLLGDVSRSCLSGISTSKAPQGNSRKKPPRRFLLPRFLSRFSFIRTHLLGDVSRACLGGIAISMPHRETRGRNRPSGFFFPGPSHDFFHENGLSLAKPRGSWQRTHLSAERHLFPSFLQEKSKELRVFPRSKSHLF